MIFGDRSGNGKHRHQAGVDWKFGSQNPNFDWMGFRKPSRQPNRDPNSSTGQYAFKGYKRAGFRRQEAEQRMNGGGYAATGSSYTDRNSQKGVGGVTSQVEKRYEKTKEKNYKFPANPWASKKVYKFPSNPYKFPSNPYKFTKKKW
jgi:hypothetical protein